MEKEMIESKINDEISKFIKSCNTLDTLREHNHYLSPYTLAARLEISPNLVFSVMQKHNKLKERQTANPFNTFQYEQMG